MSSINTNGINVNYPVPGVNNSSQGFRDNFASIKTNLDTASSEITDLQNKVVVKQALANSTVNNDMANTLISNALTRSFRASTYNLGGALSGVVTIDVSAGDVQYGTVAGNVTLQFSKWSPAGTQSNVQLVLSTTSSNNYISLPSQVDATKETLMNYADGKMNAPAELPYFHLMFSSLDCGNTVEVVPVSYPRQTSQITNRAITSEYGQPGDVEGTVSFYQDRLWICHGPYDGVSQIWLPVPGQGTVTSVGVAATQGLEVSGSPIVAAGTINIRNTGVLNANAGLGIQVSATGTTGNGNITITNTGVAGLRLGGNANVITLSSNTVANGTYTGVVTIDMLGNLPNGTVTSVSVAGGSGIAVTGNAVTTTGTFTINNTGVLSINAGKGINVSAPTGSNVTISAQANIPFANVSSSSTFTPNANSVGTIISLSDPVTSVTIPSSTFAAGDIITFYNTTSASLTFNSGPNVTCWLGGTNTSTSPRIVAVHSIATMTCVGANTFVISGAGVT